MDKKRRCVVCCLGCSFLSLIGLAPARAAEPVAADGRLDDSGLSRLRRFTSDYCPKTPCTPIRDQVLKSLARGYQKVRRWLGRGSG